MPVILTVETGLILSQNPLSLLEVWKHEKAPAITVTRLRIWDLLQERWPYSASFAEGFRHKHAGCVHIILPSISVDSSLCLLSCHLED